MNIALARNESEWSRAAIGQLDPLDRLRLVGSIEQLRPNAWPMLTKVILCALDGHPIDARAAFVTSNGINVHTQANPGGEIRGQVTPPKG